MAEASEERRGSAERAAAATAIAMNEAAHDASLVKDARTLLREQARLAQLEADQLSEEGALMRRSLHVRHASEMMKFAFELMVALVLLAIVAALGTAMWSAAHDNGLVIEAFSVPPDLAQRGLSGEVVASQLLDKLTRMQNETNSIRPAGTYRNNWGDDIKVEIPDTGISIGELNRYLRHWLGHETHITGEVYRTPAGIAVTVRAQDAGQTLTGAEGQLDSLLQRAAEAIYAETQPYRYAAFLNEKARNPEAMAVLTKLAAEAAPTERAWALALLGDLYRFYNHPAQALATYHAAVAADPANAHAWDNLANGERQLGDMEDAFQHTGRALQLFEENPAGIDPDRLATIKLGDQIDLAETLGDYRTAEGIAESVQRLPDRNGSLRQAALDEAADFAFNHDPARARRLLAGIGADGVNARLNLWFQSAVIDYAIRDWRRLEYLMNRAALFALAPPSYHPVLESVFARLEWLLADAVAQEGDIARARRIIASTPLDCYDCVRTRGRIDAAAKDWAGANYWFVKAVRQGPSIPMAYSDWGAMLLQKGDYDGAIAKFQEANLKGPHFADPLEMWGEALMQKNRSDLALAKFEEANKYAPNWGRLHLKWGEALMYVGKKDEAQKQFASASRLDLSPSDKAAFAHWMTHG